MHWLQSAATRADIPGIEALSLPFNAPAADGWDMASRVSGLAPRDLAVRLAGVLHLKAADLDEVDPPSRPLIPEKLARRHHVYPIRADDRTITVATSDPTDFDAEQALSFATGRRIIFELAAPVDITDALNSTFSVERAVEVLLNKVGADADADAVRLVEETAPEEVSQRDVDAAPIVKLTNLLLSDAVNQRASDIHVEPGTARGGMVRFRIDGVMRQYMELPPSAVTRIVSRIKVLAKLDIADRMRPQDGRARIHVANKSYDLRISTVPTQEAEKAVIRILRSDTLRSLDEMRLTPPELLRFRQLLSFREGLAVVTGPTGSGKTTTLYAAVREIATGEVNVMTVEDPVEYQFAGITQIQVDVKKGITFASALRSVLRQDPDVILVGEIRDSETAQIAAQAALTGHLVLATLHTNDAMSTVTRLAELGLDRATIAATLRGAVAQRLVRRVCSECTQPVTAPLFLDEERLMEHYGQAPAVRAVGCRRCAGTGYLGRLPVVEVALMTPSLSEQIVGGASAGALQRVAAEQGMWPMRNVALERAAAGETTLQEVDRVLGEMPTEDTGNRDGSSRGTGGFDMSLFDAKEPEPIVRERRSLGDRRRGPRRRDG
ncbi:MAG: type secretion system protein [Gemmatimonadetes bacterium]|jgi:type IV pilus assembly protein PilB|nr:type secretion system protein [Gemmatimonadota bacterium]